MHIKRITDEKIEVFINQTICNLINYKDKDEVSEFIKNTIVKLKMYYDIELNGFVRIIAHVNKNVGIMLEIKNLNNSYDEEININVVFIYDDTILYKTEDYFILKDIDEVYYYKDNFYTNIINLDNINKYIENGTFIYKDINKIINNWIKIKR